MDSSLSDTKLSCQLKTIYDISTNILTEEEAIKCLTGEYNVILPTPCVKPCNNLDEYLHKSTANTRRRSSGHDEHTYEERSRRKSRHSFTEPFAVPLVRNFEKILKKSSNDVPCTPSTSGIGVVSQEGQPRLKRMKRQDVFTRTEQIESSSGPFSHLKARMHNKVKVFIRRRRKVPYISRVIEYKGTLVIFDKHMNLYLKDVIESFSYSIGGKIMKRGRHRDGLVVRGDNIILIA